MVKRAREPPQISVQNVDLAPSAKDNQAWRYKGNQIIRAPSSCINGRQYYDHKDTSLPRRKQESNFFITINSNKAPDVDEMPVATKHMEKMLEHLAEEQYIAQFIKFGPKTPQVYASDVYADVVESINWDSAIETGDRQHRLHAHIWLTIKHYSQVQINVPMLQHLSRRLYNEGFALQQKLRITKLPYVHVKLLPQSDWTEVMRNYIHKGMSSV